MSAQTSVRVLVGALALIFCAENSKSAGAEKPFCIEVIDSASGRGVPLVELETMDNQLYVTDSAGRAAFSEPGQMGVPVWFSMRSHGYEFPLDGFGMTGMRFTPRAGEKAVVKAKRLNIAERIVRLTGPGIYRDSVLLGEKVPLAEPLGSGGVVGQDSVQTAIYKGRIFWLWGDTMRLSYPLGNFRSACAWSELPGKGGLPPGHSDADRIVGATLGLPPSQGVDFHYYTGKDGFAKEMCPLEKKEGVVWLFGLCVVRDDAGAEKLVAHYARRGGLVKLFEHGIAVFNDKTEIFERAATLLLEEKWRYPRGRATPVREGDTDYIYFGEAGLCIRVPARMKDVLDPASYEAWTCAVPGSRRGNEAGQLRAEERPARLLTSAATEFVPRRRADGTLDFAWRKDAAPIESQDEAKWLKVGAIKPEECRVTPEDVATKQRVTLHEGSVCWNEFRKRWVLIAVQHFGKPSFLGEVWYAESAAPTGPWKRAVKIVTHDRYSFYNPAQHAFFDVDGGRLIHFEGTYSHTFSGRENRTPHYDYNQILYRLDLADPRLREAQE